MELFSNLKSQKNDQNVFQVDQLKSLMDVVYQNASRHQLDILFGEENLSIKGELNGKTDKGKSFRVTF